MKSKIELSLHPMPAAIPGTLVGFQRKHWAKPVWLCTQVLAYMDCAIFTTVSKFGFSGTVDPSRVAAGT